MFGECDNVHDQLVDVEGGGDGASLPGEGGMTMNSTPTVLGENLPADCCI